MRGKLIKLLEEHEIVYKNPQLHKFLFALKTGIYDSADNTEKIIVMFLLSLVEQNQSLMDALTNIHNCSIFPTNNK